MDKNKSVLDFMNSFIDSPMPAGGKVVSSVEKEYTKLFGHAVPREMLPPAISDKQLLAAMQKCIETRQDNLLTVLGVKESSGYMY